jgi:hypothetical protein
MLIFFEPTGVNDDSPQQAVRAAEALGEMVSTMAARSGLPVKVHPRVGIYSGLFVVGQLYSGLFLARDSEGANEHHALARDAASTLWTPASPRPAAVEDDDAEMSDRLREDAWPPDDLHVVVNARSDKPVGDTTVVSDLWSAAAANGTADEAEHETAAPEPPNRLRHVLASLPWLGGPRHVALGKALESARQARGWLRSDVCRRLGISERLLIRMEAGKVRPRAGQLRQLAQVLAVPYESLAALAQYRREDR